MQKDIRTLLFPGSKNLKIDESSEISIWYLYFSSKTQFTEELALYTSLSLIAEIGGYVGLVKNAFWFFTLLFGVYAWNLTIWLLFGADPSI